MMNVNSNLPPNQIELVFTWGKKDPLAAILILVFIEKEPNVYKIEIQLWEK